MFCSTACRWLSCSSTRREEIVRANQAECVLLGYPAEEMLGKKGWDYSP